MNSSRAGSATSVLGVLVPTPIAKGVEEVMERCEDCVAEGDAGDGSGEVPTTEG